MYPYYRRTQPAQSPAPATERTQPAPAGSALSGDRRLQELLQLAEKGSAVLEQKYAALLQENRLQKAEDILKTMETDSKKHQRILREILFTLFSDTLEEILEEIGEEAEQTEAEDLLEELLLTELDDISFFRSLLSSMEDDDLWELLFEIITDKQNHAAALNHLYAKYMR